jgi:hypothetical protein
MFRVPTLVGAAALIATPLMGLPAWGAACSGFVGVGGVIPVATATASGFSCEVGQLTFSNMDVTNSPGSTVFGFIPYEKNGEFGLTLNYAAAARGGSFSDVAWLFDVTAAPGVFINDVFAELNGTITFFSGVATLGENVLNSATNALLAHIDLSLPGLAADTKFFSPVAGVSVSKDQQNVSFAGTDGLVATSLLTNAFSVVPGPIAGAGLPGLVLACGGLLGLARRRRRQIA